MHKHLVLGALAALALTPIVAHAQDDLGGLIKTFSDDSKPMKDREAALMRAVLASSRQPEPRGGPVKEALVPLLDKALSRRSDPTTHRWLIGVLRATEMFKPFPGIDQKVRSLMAKDSPANLREAGVRACRMHALASLASELEAFMREGGEDPGRESLERTILDAGGELPAPECTRIAAAALEVSKHRGVRIYAARALGESRTEAGRRVLLTTCSTAEKDELVACEAAMALSRFGTLEAAGHILERMKVRQGSRDLYRTLCKVALREGEGFGGVLPGDFYEAGREGRAAAIAAAVEWWSGAKPRTRDDLLFDQLKAKGVNVPGDRRGKEAITALIDGLSLDPRSLRYAALDLLVQRTGKTDLAEDFKTLQRKLGGNAAMREKEPPDGFQDEQRQNELKAQQVEKQAKWRSWWESVKGRAELVNDKWVVRG